jgi:hypothetical protein
VVSKRFTARLTAVAAGLALAALAIQPAAASVRPSWHAVYRYKAAGYAKFLSIAAFGRHAWAVGSGASVAADGLPAAAYYSDGRWTSTPVPNPEAAGEISAVSADSPTDAWAVAFYEVLHWHAGKWSVARAFRYGDGAPPGPVMTGVTALSPSDVWVFSDGQLGTWHLAHGKWRKASGVAANIYAASVVSGGNMWAIGGVNNNAVLHYRDGRWATAPGVPAGLTFGAIVATSPSSVWLTASPANGTGLRLVHLLGHTWTSYPVPSSHGLQSVLLGHVPEQGISPDGHGGFWLCPWSENVMLHFSAAHKWSRASLGGGDVTDFLLLPGTKEMLATGDVPVSRKAYSYSTAVIWEN